MRIIWIRIRNTAVQCPMKSQCLGCVSRLLLGLKSMPLSTRSALLQTLYSLFSNTKLVKVRQPNIVNTSNGVKLFLFIQEICLIGQNIRI